MMDTLFLFSRVPTEDELRLVATQPQGKVLLLGPAIFSSPNSFKNRTVLVLAEEVEELGAGPQLPSNFTAEPTSAVLEKLLSHRIYNF